MIISVVIICIFLGSLVGFLAGLLGIGGGLIIVPALVYLLPLLKVEPQFIMPMALATSLSSIIITSFSAMLAHHKNNNIPWLLAKRLAVFVAVGASLGAMVVDVLSAQSLKYIFAFFVILLASYMIVSINNLPIKKTVSNQFLQIISLFVGAIASLMGISGGAILVPVLNYFTFPLRQAVGIATVCGVVIALFASTVFIFSGMTKAGLPEYSLGYVYLPALIGIIISSSFFAKVGVKMATKLPVTTLKKVFAIFLIFVAVRMVWS
jgi:uncharacterized membrane protein YfcA